MSDENKKASMQIRIGGIISYLTIGINIALGLIYTPWILREVGSSNYGLYTLASSLIAMFLLDFGVSAAITRFVANFRAENRQKEIDCFVGLSIKFYILICSIIALVLVIVYLNIESIYANLTPSEITSFRVVFAITAFFVVICFPVNICNGLLNAYERYIELKVTDIINKIGTVIITVVALLLHGGIFALVFINGFLNLIAFIVKIIIIKKTIPVKVSFKKNPAVSLKSIFSFSIWTTVGTMANQMIFNLIPSVLGMVANTTAITLYGFANVIEGYVYNITQAINGLFLPSISRIVVKSDTAENTLPLMIKVGRINQTIITLLLLGLTVLGKDFVKLWVGDQYSDLYYCILLLAYPYFISASQQIANSSIIVLNKVKYTALINLFTGIFNIVIAYIVAPVYGVVGVCLVISITFMIRILLLNIVYVKELRIDIVRFFKECQFKMFPGILLSYLISAIAMRFLPSSSGGIVGWGGFIAKAIMVTVIYVVSMWLLSWNSYEKDLFKNTALRFVRRIKV